MLRKIMLMVIFLGIMTPFSVSATVTDEDLRNNTQTYISYDNDNLSSGNPLDLTPNDNDGTNNGATTGVSGIIEEAFDFDGSDYVQLPYSQSSSFTWYFWVYADNLGGAKAADMIMSQAPTRFRDALYYNHVNNEWVFILGDSANVVVNEPESNMNNQWRLVVGRYDGTEARLDVWDDTCYNIGNGTNTLSYTNSNSNMYVGVSGDVATEGQSRNWEGKIDETAVWEEYKTTDELEELCNRQSQNLSGAQYPFESSKPELSFQNISTNNQNFTNNSFWNTNTLDFDLTLDTNNTNASITTSYELDGTTNTTCGTNTTTPSCTLSGLSNGNYTIQFTAENNDTSTTSDLYAFTINQTSTSGGTSEGNLINFTRPNVTQQVTNPVTFQTLLNREGAKCDLYLDLEKIETFEDIVSFSHDRVIQEYGSHQYQVYCTVQNQTSNVTYYDTTGLIDFEVVKPEKQVSFQIYDQQENLVNDIGNLYLSTPCVREVVLLGSDNNLQTEEVYFSKVKDGFATFTLPHQAKYEMCLIRGNIYFNQSDFTKDYDVEQSEAVTEIGTVRVTNETSSYNLIINRQTDLNEPTSPGYWGVSMLEMLSTLFLILFGIVLIFIGIHDNKEGSYKVTLLGGLLILFGMGYNINLIVGALV